MGSTALARWAGMEQAARDTNEQQTATLKKKQSSGVTRYRLKILKSAAELTARMCLPVHGEWKMMPQGAAHTAM